MKRTNTSDWKVMAKQCATCPFRTDAHGRYPDVNLVNKIQTRCLTQASQICHAPRTKGKKETHLCRGARNFQLDIFYKLGFLSEPTDEAWNQKVKNI